MQKRDKFGKFVKGKVVKKKAKKKVVSQPKRGKIKVITERVERSPKFKPNRPKLSELDLYDLQDMIQAEVMFQMKEIW